MSTQHLMNAASINPDDDNAYVSFLKDNMSPSLTVDHPSSKGVSNESRSSTEIHNLFDDLKAMQEEVILLRDRLHRVLTPKTEPAASGGTPADTESTRESDLVEAIKFRRELVAAIRRILADIEARLEV